MEYVPIPQKRCKTLFHGSFSEFFGVLKHKNLFKGVGHGRYPKNPDLSYENTRPFELTILGPATVPVVSPT